MLVLLMALLISKMSSNTTMLAVVTLAAFSLSSVLILPRVSPTAQLKVRLERLDNPTSWSRSRPRTSCVLRADGAGFSRVPVPPLRMESLLLILGVQGNTPLTLTGDS